MKKKKPTPEDILLFKQTVGAVKNIEHNRLHLCPTKKPAPIPRLKIADVTEKLNPKADVSTDYLSAEDTLSFLSNGLQKNILKKMRRGHFGIDAELDLHGLTSTQAKQRLLHFLHACVENGCRCVHVIHGKGYGSENNLPVLKNSLNLWLRQHNDVQAFARHCRKTAVRERF